MVTVTTDEDGNKIAPINEVKLNSICLNVSNNLAFSRANYKEQAALTSYAVATIAILFLINSVGHTTQSSTSKKRN
ncbi:MAG: hypothetical protein Q4C83_01235 [Candidatus Saccharibacteria bacterium]|nr:hypothetical protein [Candidatus Saccharibacteria bacterium]